jgi:ornithine cyclodeaminase/alanine dehydrogenase-like protein (mu-crystallin family)
MALLLREADVQRLVTMEDALDCLEKAFSEWAAGRASNQPRRRVREGVSLAIMSAALPSEKVVGYKAYTVSRSGARFWLHLFDSDGGRPVAVIEADQLGRMRTGAASGLATKYLAREDASRLAIFGTGSQALTQVLGVVAVRSIKKVMVVGRNAERRKRFMDGLARRWEGRVEESGPDMAVDGADIITTITSSSEPLFDGSRLKPGQHLNVAGSNFPNRREVDGETIQRSEIVVADDVEAARVEAGELLIAEREGKLDWSQVRSLREVLAGQVKRTSRQQISLFKSVGLAIEDVALGVRVLARARATGLGEQLAL